MEIYEPVNPAAHVDDAAVLTRRRTLIEAMADVPVFWSALRYVLEGGTGRVGALVTRFAGDDGRWLDVGCGIGHVAASLAPERYLGIDLVGRRLDRAARAYPRHCFERADATGDLSALGAFDGALVIHLLHHLDDAHVAAVGAGLRRAMPGGKILVVDPYPAAWGNNFIQRNLIRLETGIHHRVPEHSADLLGVRNISAAGDDAGSFWFRAYWFFGRLEG